MPRSRTALRRLARLNRLLSGLSLFESPTSARKWFWQRGRRPVSHCSLERKRLTNYTADDADIVRGVVSKTLTSRITLTAPAMRSFFRRRATAYREAV